MAISFPSQTVSTAENPNLDLNDQTFSINVPNDVDGGVLADDWIIVTIMHTQSEDGGPWTVTWDDAEWANNGSWFQTGGTPPSTPGIQIYAMKAVGGEDGDTLTGTAFGETNPARYWVAACFVVRGIDPSTPLDVARTTATGSTGTPDAPSITPATNFCMALIVVFADSTTGATGGSVPANYTQIARLAPTVIGGLTSIGVMGVAYRLLTGGASTPENPGAWQVQSSTTEEWGAVTLALRTEEQPPQDSFPPVLRHIRTNTLLRR